MQLSYLPYSQLLSLQEQGEADKAKLKQQLEADLEANRRQRDKVQAERQQVEAALEKLELDNRARAEGIRQQEALAAKARAAELAAEEAKKKDLILQLRYGMLDSNYEKVSLTAFMTRAMAKTARLLMTKLATVPVTKLATIIVTKGAVVSMKKSAVGSMTNAAAA